MSLKYNENFDTLIKQAQEGDLCAREKIISENTGLVHSVVKRFSGRGTELEDLFQIGCIGLIKAIDKFDTSYNVKFSTYAVPMILGEIKRFLRDDGIIKVSRSLKEMSAKAMGIKEAITKEKGSEPTVWEIAERMGVTPEELSCALDASRRPESIFSAGENEKGDKKELIEKLESPVNFESQVINKIMLDDILKTFSERDKKVINLRYFRQKTQTETAKVLGISQVQVSRIEKKILCDMREKILK